MKTFDPDKRLLLKILQDTYLAKRDPAPFAAEATAEKIRAHIWKNSSSHFHIAYNVPYNLILQRSFLYAS